jgi:hypothetical protein
LSKLFVDEIQPKTTGGIINFNPNRPSFCTETKPSSVSNGATIVWSSTLFNTSNSYSTSTGKFTAPVTGIYQFQFQVMFTSFNPAQIRFFKTPSGGSQDTLSEVKSQGFSGIVHILNDSRCVQLNVNDTVHVFKDTGTLVTNTDKAFASFSGFLIG